MKRPSPEKPYQYLWRHFGLFAWQACALCRNEFRRERGWRFLSGPWVKGYGVTRYLCADCGGEAKATATAAIARWSAPPPSPTRPPPPPPPPPHRDVRGRA